MFADRQITNAGVPTGEFYLLFILRCRTNSSYVFNIGFADNIVTGLISGSLSVSVILVFFSEPHEVLEGNHTGSEEHQCGN